MPRYDFRCEQCGDEREVVRPMSEFNSPVPCAACGTKMARVFSAAVQFITKGDKVDRANGLIAESLRERQEQISGGTGCISHDPLTGERFDKQAKRAQKKFAAKMESRRKAATVARRAQRTSRTKYPVIQSQCIPTRVFHNQWKKEGGNAYGDTEGQKRAIDDGFAT